MNQASADKLTDVYDVVIIGGGPAGSTIAALLAASGRSVVLLEKDQHPRFHIGESLLPFNIPLFKKLGVLDDVARIGMPKFGIEFVSPQHDQPSFLEFADSWCKDMDYSFQVRRSEFDLILLRNAAEQGAEVVENSRVIDVEFPEDGGVAVAAITDDRNRQFHTRFLVDASGRDTFLADRMKIKRRDPRHASAAIYGHFTDTDRLPGRAAGNISIFWFEKGWFWLIPLADGVTSVGAVCRPEVLKSRDCDVTSFFMSLIAMCPALAARLTRATLTLPPTGTGNYSYECERLYGDRYIMVGDASGFIDPVFSTGVYLAMRGAFLGADVVATCLDHPEHARVAMKNFEREVRRSLAQFSWFIYRIAAPAIRDLFMARGNVFGIKSAVLALLSGDVKPNWPIRFRLTLFKVLYYTKALIGITGSMLTRRSEQPRQ